VAEKPHDAIVKFDTYRNTAASRNPPCDSMALVYYVCYYYWTLLKLLSSLLLLYSFIIIFYFSLVHSPQAKILETRLELFDCLLLFLKVLMKDTILQWSIITEIWWKSWIVLFQTYP